MQARKYEEDNNLEKISQIGDLIKSNNLIKLGGGILENRDKEMIYLITDSQDINLISSLGLEILDLSIGGYYPESLNNQTTLPNHYLFDLSSYKDPKDRKIFSKLEDELFSSFRFNQNKKKWSLYESSIGDSSKYLAELNNFYNS